MPDRRLNYPATSRNRGPILDVLQRVLPRSGGLLVEIASGSGQHSAWMIGQLPGWEWLPTDVEADALDSIAGWRAHTGEPRLRAPLALDVRAPTWPVASAEAVFCANMIHIAPWECAEGLLAGVGRILAPGGRFVLYGPFMVDGAHTSPSNAAFHASLQRRDARWGVRPREAVEALAQDAGLAVVERADMPANNQVLVFGRAGSA